MVWTMGRADHPFLTSTGKVVFVNTARPTRYQVVVSSEIAELLDDLLHVLATQVRHVLRTKHNFDTLPHVEDISEFAEQGQMAVTWYCPYWWRKA